MLALTSVLFCFGVPGFGVALRGSNEAVDNFGLIRSGKGTNDKTHVNYLNRENADSQTRWIHSNKNLNCCTRIERNGQFLPNEW